MRFGFGKKFSVADIEREAQAELDSAVKRAKPPTEAERTWVLPPPEVPNLFASAPPRRQPARRPPVLPRVPGPDRGDAFQADEDFEFEEPEEMPPPRRARTAAPRAAKARPAPGAATSGAAVKRVRKAQPGSRPKSPTKRAPTPRRSTGGDPGRPS